jgi:hypothetical protein
MYSYILQDWTTLNVSAQWTSVVQSEADWLSFQPYQDIVVWVETRSANAAGADCVDIQFETSPSRDESLFLPMRPAVALTPGTPAVVPVVLSQIVPPDVPLARWVRWRLKINGAPAADWGAAFRVQCTANAIGPL